jgi:hypothetical protein
MSASRPRSAPAGETIAPGAPDLVNWRARIEASNRSQQENPMPNLAALPLQALGLLAAVVFVASLIGHSLVRNPLIGAILTVILFVAAYVFWNYYDHSLLPGVRFRLA